MAATLGARAALVAVVATALLAGLLGAGWWRQAQRAAPLPSAVDIGFAQAMSLHHRQAIGMAQLMLDGRATPLAALARQIAATQLVEFGEMQGWLKLWGAPVALLKPPMDWMRLGARAPDPALEKYLLACAASPTGMLGLATDVEVARLRALEGRARDAHFLALLRAHHEGGLPMARFAAAEASLAVVRRLAANVVREQSHDLMLISRTQAAMAATAEGLISPAAGADGLPILAPEPVEETTP